jgi:hypothetical protein
MIHFLWLLSRIFSGPDWAEEGVSPLSSRHSFSEVDEDRVATISTLNIYKEVISTLVQHCYGQMGGCI